MNVLVIGATSAIAGATARLYASRASHLFLMARDPQRLQQMQADLSVRGAASVDSACLDLRHHDQHQAAVDAAMNSLGSIDLALLCYGVLPDQQQVEGDFERVREALEVNGLSVISLLIILAAKLEQQTCGKIAVVTSVAGERGRRSNYVYGAGKALVSAYLEGLRGRLLPHGIQVIDIRPGLVDSPMTARFHKGLLWSSPERIAAKIVKSVDRNRHVVYAPGYWRPIMWLVRAIPEALFKRMRY